MRSTTVARAIELATNPCIYEATGPDAIRKHAEASGFSADEINEVADTVIIRADPVEATA